MRYQRDGRPVLPAVQVLADRQPDDLATVVRQMIVPLDLMKIFHVDAHVSPRPFVDDAGSAATAFSILSVQSSYAIRIVMSRT
jgi:hypothetical protein